jgi:16S rRNA (adenine(1408)-N(1))-methyltransferase
MRRTAARAAAKPAKGGQPNAIFVWAAVEDLPLELTEVTELHCLMPWGSLLRTFVTPDEELLRGIAARCRPAAGFLLTLNLHAWRPPVPEVGATGEPTPESMARRSARYASSGWRIDAADYLDPAGLAELGTSWTKRLGSSRDALDVLAVRGTIQPPAGD